jgi:hypothetical protein
MQIAMAEDVVKQLAQPFKLVTHSLKMAVSSLVHSCKA